MVVSVILCYSLFVYLCWQIEGSYGAAIETYSYINIFILFLSSLMYFTFGYQNKRDRKKNPRSPSRVILSNKEANRKTCCYKLLWFVVCSFSLVLFERTTQYDSVSFLSFRLATCQCGFCGGRSLAYSPILALASYRLVCLYVCLVMRALSNNNVTIFFLWALTLCALFISGILHVTKQMIRREAIKFVCTHLDA